MDAWIMRRISLVLFPFILITVAAIGCRDSRPTRSIETIDELQKLSRAFEGRHAALSEVLTAWGQPTFVKVYRVNNRESVGLVYNIRVKKGKVVHRNRAVEFRFDENLRVLSANVDTVWR